VSMKNGRTSSPSVALRFCAPDLHRHPPNSRCSETHIKRKILACFRSEFDV
jgi:hypothetical protein